MEKRVLKEDISTKSKLEPVPLLFLLKSHRRVCQMPRKKKRNKGIYMYSQLNLPLVGIQLHHNTQPLLYLALTGVWGGGTCFVGHFLTVDCMNSMFEIWLLLKSQLKIV